MKHCDCCNIDLSDSFQFCPSCASALSDSRRCSRCGELAKSHWEFCTTCGAGLPLSGIKASPISRAAKPVVQAELSIPQHTDSFPDSFEEVQETPASAQLEVFFEDPTRTKQNGKERTTTSVLEHSDPSEIHVDPTGTYEYLYPRRRGGHVITGLANHDTERKLSYELLDETIEARTPPTLSLLQSYGPTSETSLGQWRHTAVLALIVLCVVGTLGFGGWYVWSRSSSSASPSVAARAQNEVDASEKPSNSALPKPASTVQAINNSASDERLATLQDIRSKANPSERGEIIAALEEAETTYPNDYRFPYERAKLTIVGVHSHEESFAALMRAAEIAVNNRKAELMLENLMADRSGDFRKLSHGHVEWSTIEEALRNRNTAALKTPHNNPSDDQ